MKLLHYIIIFLIFFIHTNTQSARELIIYADSIDYDSEKNMIAKGNVKIISDSSEVITSNIIIIQNESNKIILPKEFQYRDEGNNYYYGTSGEFDSNMDEALINDLKIYLSDGSRIVGKKGFKKGKIDLIDKGVFSPCKSKINIANFVCPIWQVDGEKILHDRNQLFIHQKHSKLRILNIPVYYFPYIITPSPLRKERKSGFLNPSIGFNFLDAQVAQSIAIPYYFAISEDKELLLTPKFNYGGGTDSSQRISTRYGQITSGGHFGITFAADTNLENENNESWLDDASVITTYSNNINEHFSLNFESAFQTSPTYLRRTDQNNILNRKNTLTTSLSLDGHDLRKFDDKLHIEITGYQVVRNNEDNKTTPTTFPYIKYNDGTNNYKNIKYNQKYSFYNIFRDIATDSHAQQQQKINYNLSTDTEFYRFMSKLNFKTELLGQYYNIENKKVYGVDYTGTYGRVFPMSGIYLETPLIDRVSNLYILPKISLVINGSQPSSDKVSNEESTNNSYSLLNNSSLNRFTGSDKLDNSKRMNYGIDIKKDLINISLAQSYEFDANSNYNKEVGLKDYMSDLLGSISYKGEKNQIGDSFRFNVDQGVLQSHTISWTNKSFIGTTSASYSEEKVENNSILEKSSETLKVNYSSNKFLDYSTIGIASTFDLIKDDPTKYSAGYQYVDECFGVNIDFNRSFYSDRDLKPKDTLTILFSFKHLGSYTSSNLAVSETDKQNIEWKTGSTSDSFFD
ncbi:MAG: LPS-assembly protein LptD [Alphaproteobacteria bacterium MarineAlpha5_Bin7]|nr:MAG: LPS-assembly protein LptD [Alphaproteobacteria bacterium MarineAlpha5_Bin7]|tara:strand:- start:48 stop:2270 length:2223 start_codon:yes stop_codon:yes gene_type:complete